MAGIPIGVTMGLLAVIVALALLSPWALLVTGVCLVGIGALDLRP